MKKNSYLFLIWKDPISRRNYTVGKLGKNDDIYSFEYYGEFENAKGAGWDLIQAFPDVKLYESKELFPVFSSRLPDRKRQNIDDILRKYNLDSYDGYELLKQSGGRLPIDTYEFVDPIFDEDKTVEKDFFLVGVRHLCECEGGDCEKRPQVYKGMSLILKMEPNNKYDTFAIQVKTSTNIHIGYIPRYYSQSISNRLNSGMDYECIIQEINDGNCQECVKVKLIMPRR